MAETISERVKYAWNKAGLTQKQTHEKAGIKSSTIRHSKV